MSSCMVPSTLVDAEHVINIVDVTNLKAVRRLTWEAEMIESARQQGCLLGSVLPDMVGLFHDMEVRSQAPVDATVWRTGGAGPTYHAYFVAVHTSLYTRLYTLTQGTKGVRTGRVPSVRG
jgi:hypothetical protein